MATSALALAPASAWTGTARAQAEANEANEANDAPSTSELRLATKLLHHQRASMTTLTGWGAASVGAGGALMLANHGDAFVFWGGLQHLMWGATNIAIAGGSLFSANHTRVHTPRPEGYWRRRAIRMRRVFWINAALDVLYIGAGALLWTLADRDAVRGSGAAVLIQGGALFGFDIAAALSLPSP